MLLYQLETENGESESGFIMSLFCLSYIINSKLGRAYAITNEIRDEFFLALENLVTQPPHPTPSSPNFRSFSADLFLASQDALEVMLVSEWVSQSVSESL